MSKAFRKRGSLIDYSPRGSSIFGRTIQASTKSVIPKGSKLPVTYVEMKTLDVSELDEQVDMPLDEDYKLETMLKNGIIPEEVPVSGLLDSSDPLDLSNAGVADAAFSQLSSIAERSAAPEPAPVAPEPAPSSSPAE